MKTKMIFPSCYSSRKKLHDYKKAMYQAVVTVAEAEHKSVEQVMLYLLNPNTDILKIRLEKKILKWEIYCLMMRSVSMKTQKNY